MTGTKPEFISWVINPLVDSQIWEQCVLSANSSSSGSQKTKRLDLKNSQAGELSWRLGRAASIFCELVTNIAETEAKPRTFEIPLSMKEGGFDG